VYLSESLSLALLELLVHLDDESLLESYVAFEVHVPASLINRPATKDLPRHWSRSPIDRASQIYGDRFLTTGSPEVALALPSVVVRSEINYLVNPLHPQFAKLRIGKPQPIRIDRRLR
ncbi:MAG: RES family NAD+ phosphorylase, partial [Phycisphaerales bacterium]|nr:RES family NAD+ phosphorylase [Phycisphaerales bacterium]